MLVAGPPNMKKQHKKELKRAYDMYCRDAQ